MPWFNHITIRDIIIKTLVDNNESWSDVISYNINGSNLDTVGDFKGFNVWTTKYVYFDLYVEGMIIIEKVLRNPDNNDINLKGDKDV